MKKKSIILTISLALLVFTGCKKYLDEKANKTTVVASTIQDAQSLLDNYTGMNKQASLSDGGVMDDNVVITDAYYDRMDSYLKRIYLWDSSAIGNDALWKITYQYISQANVALETLNRILPTNSEIESYNLAKGGALFFRAFFHHQIILIYALQYDKSKAASTAGIPYKITSDINDPTTRPSLQANFDMLINDLKQAAAVLPTQAIPVSRPSKSAAFGMLSRVYLSMNDYDNSRKYADSALAINSTLINYNTIPTPSASSTIPPLGNFNSETIFYASGQSPLSFFSTANWMCDPALYNSYDNNDLRRSLFYLTSRNQANYFTFRGQYDVTSASPTAGIITDELYITKAECLARQGNISDAMNVLNTLLVTRWKTNTYIQMSAIDKDDALRKILIERRKELVMRNNLRWMDIKRLNLDPNYAISLTRKVKGITYTLPPNDLRFALLLPITVIQLSGIEQNKR